MLHELDLCCWAEIDTVLVKFEHFLADGAFLQLLLVLVVHSHLLGQVRMATVH